MPVEVDSPSAATGAVVVAILVAVSAPFVRYLNGRAAAGDAAHAAHVTSLTGDIANLRAELRDVRSEMKDQAKEMGRYEARLKLVEEHNVDLSKSNMQLQSERDAALAENVHLKVELQTEQRENATMLALNEELNRQLKAASKT